jgi:hypothetical protein
MIDRQEFFSLMSDAVAERSAPADNGLVPPGRAKTRVLEAHPAERSSEGAHRLLREIAEPLGLTVRETGDELWTVRGRDLVAFVDTLNPRFWQLHSTSSAVLLQRIVRRILFGDARLDAAWFPTALLRELEGAHSFIRSSFQADELLGDDVSARRWRARFEGDTPEDLLELLATDDRYGRTATVTQIGSLVEEPSVGRAAVIADYQGLFVTGRGDFSVAASAAWNLISRYEEWVTALEERHRVIASPLGGAALNVSPLDGGGLTVKGDVATIEFGRDVEDLDRLVEGLFTAKEPFRLWAVPRRAGDNEWTADAVDLHVGQPLRMQISPHRVRVLLEPETCGNTLARLLTNLQQRLDARARLLTAA